MIMFIIMILEPKALFTYPVVNCHFDLRCLKVKAAAAAWNLLPSYFKSSTTADMFKKYLLSYMLSLSS